ncbi:MAG: coenzyme F420-0:L-glutamate ligase [Polyangiaceae bacterium]|nr:coenzyme F420-0:L-glutamate ligase [Polyangiaceae bacterium]
MISRLLAFAVPGLPLVGAGDDLAALVLDRLAASSLELCAGDVVMVTSKIVSRAEGRFVDLSLVTPSVAAEELAREVRADARLVELVLSESVSVSRKRAGALVVRHRLGFVTANAGVDLSNAAPPTAPAGSGPWALALPRDPDASAERLRRALRADGALAVIITDSFGRPFRVGTVGVAIGVAGLSPLVDQRGERDLFGRVLEHTIAARADQLAALSDLVAGQAAERQPVVVVRGVDFSPVDGASARALCRPADGDLYA